MSATIRNKGDKPRTIVENGKTHVELSPGGSHGHAMNEGDVLTIEEADQAGALHLEIEAGEHALILTVGETPHDVAPGATFTVRGPAEVKLELKPVDEAAGVAGEAQA